MTDPKGREFPAQVQTVVQEFVPIIRQWDVGTYAISIGGSMGKATWDHRSDIDFRLFHEKELLWPHQDPEIWKDFLAAVERWKEKGVRIDGIWPRKIAEVDADLDLWLAGEARPLDLVWTIWGYHLLPDVNNQAVIEDPEGIIQKWKERLAHYPEALQKKLLERHGGSLRYWLEDYHYENKVERGDIVFLAGLTSRLVHDILQVLFALNQTYYVGDGQNLDFAEGFTVKPANFRERVSAILYPECAPERLIIQRDTLRALIAETLALVDRERDNQ